jgi:hypothetical protein
MALPVGAPLDKGFLSFELSAASPTDVGGGMRIPRLVEATFFFPDTSAHPPKLYRSGYKVISVKSVSTTVEPITPPPLPGWADVLDLRFTDTPRGGHYHYQETNAVWVARSDPNAFNILDHKAPVPVIHAGNIPSSELEKGTGVDFRLLLEVAVEEEVQKEAQSYGDRMTFIEALEMEGTTLEQFRQRIRDEVTGRLGEGLWRNAAGKLVGDNVILPEAWVRKITFRGNTKFTDAELLRWISTKVGDPLDGRKIDMDVELIRTAYQQAGAKDAQVKYCYAFPEVSGWAQVEFRIFVPPGPTK